MFQGLTAPTLYRSLLNGLVRRQGKKLLTPFNSGGRSLPLQMEEILEPNLFVLQAMWDGVVTCRG